MLRIIAIVLCWLFASLAVSSVYAQRTGNPEKDAELADRQAKKRGNTLRIADNAPDRYTVVKGDTLWDIASKFLLDPWRWPELWRGNRDQIRDPHWIYPGDVLVLDRKTGTLSVLTTDRSVKTTGENRLSPKLYSSELDKPIPVLRANVVEAYLARPHVVEASEVDGKVQLRDELGKAPLVIEGKEGRTLLGSGDIAYVSGLEGEQLDWNVFRPGKVLKDPVSGEVLGTEAIYLGKARVIRRGEPAEVRITATKLEITRGDRLVVATRQPISNLVLKSPDKAIEGRVISIYGGVDTGGPHSIVALNRGKRDGLKAGDVLAVFRSTNVLEYKPLDGGQNLKLQPADDRYGLVTVFHVGERISYALVVNAGRELAVGDTVSNP